MIGYMKPLKGAFSKEDQDLYRSFYCGLCRTLKYEYGVTSMAALNYELVSVLLLLAAMAPEPSRLTSRSCSMTPLYWRKMAGENDGGFYGAASVTVIAAFLELQDNLHDSGRWYDRLLAAVAKPSARRVQQRHQLQWQELQDLYDAFMVLEQRAAGGDPGVTFQMLMDANGVLIGTAASIIGSFASCQQLQPVYEIMNLWGQWLYLLDAADDYEDDRCKGHFNPLSLSDRPEDLAKALADIEEKANACLDGAPILHYRTLLDSLFRVQMPRRREIVLEKSGMTAVSG